MPNVLQSNPFQFNIPSSLICLSIHCIVNYYHYYLYYLYSQFSKYNSDVCVWGSEKYYTCTVKLAQWLFSLPSTPFALPLTLSLSIFLSLSGKIEKKITLLTLTLVCGKVCIGLRYKETVPFTIINYLFLFSYTKFKGYINKCNKYIHNNILNLMYIQIIKYKL